MHVPIESRSGGHTADARIADAGRASLSAAPAIAETTGYHGQLSLDFKRTERGLVLLECNPRPTAGVFVMTSEMFVNALAEGAARGSGRDAAEDQLRQIRRGVN